MLFYDFEVLKYDWLTVIIDTVSKQEYDIINDRDKLIEFYENHTKDIWVGFNNKHYDQYILKGIMLGMNPKDINDQIILQGMDGWQISKAFNKIPMINYDVFSSKSAGLKTLEGFMGLNIKETDVPFDIDRKLTDEEIQMTLEYCRNDVEQTMNVFMLRIDDFNTTMSIVNEFGLSVSHVGDTDAQITATVLGCNRTKYDDEFDYYFLPCLRINKYKQVLDWFESLKGNPNGDYNFYKQSLTIEVAGIPHVFGFGGLHGADDKPRHYKGALFHVDVNNYYPSMLIAWDLVTRSATNDNFTKIYNTRKALKMKQIQAKTKEEKKYYKKKQLPYKLMLNALSGAMKDKANPACDQRNNNIMCINGQLMLLDLIEHLEVIEGFELIQSNTDGLIVMIPDTDEAFNQLDDICYEWETRCSTDKCLITLETDQIREIYQKDVNNYVWIDIDGNVETKGAYVKELSSLDNDLPIVNKALVDYMTKGIPIEETINNCQDLIMFQKIVKLSSKYHHVEHEHCVPKLCHYGVRVIKSCYTYPKTIKYDYKCYRVFASKDNMDGRILKVKLGKKGEKFGNTPEHCFIDNEDITNKKVPNKLDKSWYIDLARKRLNDYGVKYG